MAAHWRDNKTNVLTQSEWGGKRKEGRSERFWKRVQVSAGQDVYSLLLVHLSLSSFAFVSALLSVWASKLIVSFSGFMPINHYSVYFRKWKSHLYGCWLPSWGLSKMENLLPASYRIKTRAEEWRPEFRSEPKPLVRTLSFLWADVNLQM